MPAPRQRRSRQPALAPEAAALVRQAFEPRYGHALDDAAVEGIADRFRRLTDLLVTWDAEDQARAQAAEPAAPALAASPRRSR